jgi:hypothetical protein
MTLVLCLSGSHLSITSLAAWLLMFHRGLDFQSARRWIKGVEDANTEASNVNGVACYEYQSMHAGGRS